MSPCTITPTRKRKYPDIWMSEKDLILSKFREYRCIVQGVKAKQQSTDKYKQNLSMKKLLKFIFHFFTIPYGHTAVLESYSQVNPNKIIFKTGVINCLKTSDTEQMLLLYLLLARDRQLIIQIRNALIIYEEGAEANSHKHYIKKSPDWSVFNYFLLCIYIYIYIYIYIQTHTYTITKKDL